MFTEIKSKEDLERFKDFKLCYVDQVEETTIYYPEPDETISKEAIESGWFSWERYPGKEIPNPEKEKGDYVLYFTSRFETQWGDDWNDSPYEHNAGLPYDTDYKETDKYGKNIKHEIAFLFLKVYDDPSIWPKLPLDYSSNGNSPFSVEDINHGAVPWLFMSKTEEDGTRSYHALNAGDTLETVIDKLKKINIQRDNNNNEQLY